jgi:hypothetical protein
MTDSLWLVAVVLSGALLAATTFAALVGGLGALTGGRFERCSHCGRHGLATGGPLHGNGCPPHRYSDRLAHLRHDGWSGLHLPHH